VCVRSTRGFQGTRFVVIVIHKIYVCDAKKFTSKSNSNASSFLKYIGLPSERRQTFRSAGRQTGTVARLVRNPGLSQGRRPTGRALPDGIQNVGIRIQGVRHGLPQGIPDRFHPFDTGHISIRSGGLVRRTNELQVFRFRVFHLVAGETKRRGRRSERSSWGTRKKGGPSRTF
jgi:hypothetical protein